jgi:hypothetical protein
VEVDAADAELVVCRVEPDAGMQNPQNGDQVSADAAVERLSLELADRLDAPSDSVPRW